VAAGGEGGLLLYPRTPNASPAGRHPAAPRCFLPWGSPLKGKGKEGAVGRSVLRAPAPLLPRPECRDRDATRAFQSSYATDGRGAGKSGEWGETAVGVLYFAFAFYFMSFMFYLIFDF
jgi:hypothetical protein